MGTSTVSFQQDSFEANDALLEVWLLTVVRQIDRLPDCPPWLQELRDEWHLQATSEFGFGVVPNLDRFITDDGRRELLHALCEQALNELARYGDVIPRDALQRTGAGGPGVTFTKSLPTSLFVEVGRQFTSLLRLSARDG